MVTSVTTPEILPLANTLATELFAPSNHIGRDEGAQGTDEHRDDTDSDDKPAALEEQPLFEAVAESVPSTRRTHRPEAGSHTLQNTLELFK